VVEVCGAKAAVLLLMLVGTLTVSELWVELKDVEEEENCVPELALVSLVPPPLLCNESVDVALGVIVGVAAEGLGVVVGGTTGELVLTRVVSAAFVLVDDAGLELLDADTPTTAAITMAFGPSQQSSFRYPQHHFSDVGVPSHGLTIEFPLSS